MIKFGLKTLLFIPFFFLIFNSATLPSCKDELSDPISEIESVWVDSVFNTLDLEHKIAQLIMLPAYPKQPDAVQEQMVQIIKEYGIGGIIFFKSSPYRQATITNKFQEASQIPLLIAGDYEWGLDMRMDSILPFPKQMMLGALREENLIYSMGEEFARQLKALGIHINFAPVSDINNNPNNPVIGYRSFGENPDNVTRKSFAYAMGLQHNKVLPTLKHFPGHGDTDTDSHKALPVIGHNRHRLDSVELYPFRELIKAGVAGIMVAHLHVPALDSTKNSISSISKPIITDLLKNDFKFKGITFTDALDMNGIANNYPSGLAEVEALKAGVDILLMPRDFKKTISAVKKAVSDSTLTIETINTAVKKVLKTKFWAGLNHYHPIKTNNLKENIVTEQTKNLREQIIQNAITLVENKQNILPIQKLDSVVVASIVIGGRTDNKFQTTLGLYTNVLNYSISKHATIADFKAMKNKVKNADIVIVSLHNTWKKGPTYGISKQSIDFISKLSKSKKVVLDIFASPYALELFKKNKNLQAILVSYEDNYTTQHFSAQAIFGGIKVSGRLPVSAGNYPYGCGINQKKIRLKYANPLDVNISPANFHQIDSIITGAIKDQATPGAVILAARNGTVFFHKAYGYHTYEKKQQVLVSDLYDIASVTKIAATTNTLMQLDDKGKFDLKKKLSDYLPQLAETNKKDIKIKDVLSHQARLWPWIPFYLHTFDLTKGYDVLNDSVYSTEQTEKFSLKVAENLYITPNYTETIYQEIYDSKLRRRARYYYSDLGFYLFYQIIDSIAPYSLEEYVKYNFYDPIGATTLGYNPYRQFDKSRIIPTENDKRFRKQLLQGYVHDYGAAMMGGVGGHAGLFTNANDLAKIGQMWLNKGNYGDKQYIKSSTIEEYTKAHFKKKGNRRGFGFDKPNLKGHGTASKYASSESFGHTGFTGIMIWVDPKYDLIYIFLSNRIHPDIKNKKLIRNDIRSKVQDVFYESIMDKKK